MYTNTLPFYVDAHLTIQHHAWLQQILLKHLNTINNTTSQISIQQDCKKNALTMHTHPLLTCMGYTLPKGDPCTPRIWRLRARGDVTPHTNRNTHTQFPNHKLSLPPRLCSLAHNQNNHPHTTNFTSKYRSLIPERRSLHSTSYGLGGYAHMGVVIHIHTLQTLR